MFQRPARDAVAFRVPDGEPVTYGELHERAAALAARLRAAGIAAGDRRALGAGRPRVPLPALGVLAARATAAPLNSALTEDGFAFYLEDLAPRVLLLPNEGLAPARAEAAATAVAVLELDGATHAGSDALEERQPHDVAHLLHTSGTTSRLKP